MDWGEAKADFTDAVIDNAFRGGYIAGRYLIERGHREIGVIPGPLERNTGAGRLAGFMQAMKEAHISVPENWIVQGDFEPESGYRAMQRDPKPAAPPDGGLLRRRYHGDGRYLARRMKWDCGCRRTFR